MSRLTYEVGSVRVRSGVQKHGNDFEVSDGHGGNQSRVPGLHTHK
jgi:hypothetical protein